MCAEAYIAAFIGAVGTMIAAVIAVYVASKLTWGTSKKERARQNAEEVLGLVSELVERIRFFDPRQVEPAIDKEVARHQFEEAVVKERETRIELNKAIERQH